MNSQLTASGGAIFLIALLSLGAYISDLKKTIKNQETTINDCSAVIIAGNYQLIGISESIGKNVDAVPNFNGLYTGAYVLSNLYDIPTPAPMDNPCSGN